MTNIQDPAIQQPKQQTNQPKHSDSTLDTQDSAMQRPAKATLSQPKQPQQPKIKQRFFRWNSCVFRLLLPLFVALLFRFLFELVPEMKAEMAKPYQVFTFGTKVLKWVYDFVFGFFGSLFRWELGSFFPQVWEGIKELASAFIALF